MTVKETPGSQGSSKATRTVKGYFTTVGAGVTMSWGTGHGSMPGVSSVTVHSGCLPGPVPRSLGRAPT